MDVGAMIQAYPIVLQVLTPLLFHLIGLTIAVCMDGYLSRRQRGILLAVIAAVCLLIAQNYVEHKLSNGAPQVLLRTGVAVAGYCIRPLILVLFLFIVNPAKSIWAPGCCWA